MHLNNVTDLDLSIKHDHAMPPQTEDFKALRVLYPDKWPHQESPDSEILLPRGQTWPEFIQRSFYSTLNEDILKKLYEIYRLDFELFGYSIHPYDLYVQE